MEDTSGTDPSPAVISHVPFPASRIYGFRRLDKLRHTAETFMTEPYIRTFECPSDVKIDEEVCLQTGLAQISLSFFPPSELLSK